MSKAVLFISVLSMLALLAVPVIGEPQAADKGLDRQMAPSTKPDTCREAQKELQLAPKVNGFRKAEVEGPVQIAGYWRAPKA